MLYDGSPSRARCISRFVALFVLSLGVTRVRVSSGESTTCDYEVPAYMKDIGRELRTLDVYDAYVEDRETMLERMGPRNLSYLRSENYDSAHAKTTLSIEEYLKTEEDEKDSEDTKNAVKKENSEYDSGGSRSIDARHTIPLISLWPGYTPFTFDFPTPGELAMRFTRSEEFAIERVTLDDDPNEPLRWDHLVHTPKMIVIDFDYTLTNFSTDLFYAPLTPYEHFPAAIDYRGYIFVPHDDVRRILIAMRSKGVKTAVIAKDRRPELVESFLKCTNLTHLIDYVDLYHLKHDGDTIDFLKDLSHRSKIPLRDMIYFDENYQSCRDAFRLGATPQRCYQGITMKVVNLCLNQHNQFNIHGVLPHRLYTATGIPGISREEFEDKERNPFYMSTMSPEDYKKEYEQHIEALNKQLKPGHPPFPRWTKWRN